jgi:hypothetical protein
MAQGDVILREPAIFSSNPTKRYQVAASATLIYPGEPVYLAASEDAVVVKSATVLPTTAAPTAVGIAATTSTNTATLAGYVDVHDAIALPGQVYLCKALDATAINTQAKYDALVNERCAFDLTTGTFTIQTTSAGGTDGLVIVASEIKKFPGYVAFEYRPSSLEKY